MGYGIQHWRRGAIVYKEFNSYNDNGRKPQVRSFVHWTFQGNSEIYKFLKARTIGPYEDPSNIPCVSIEVVQSTRGFEEATSSTRTNHYSWRQRGVHCRRNCESLSAEARKEDLNWVPCILGRIPSTWSNMGARRKPRECAGESRRVLSTHWGQYFF